MTQHLLSFSRFRENGVLIFFSNKLYTSCLILMLIMIVSIQYLSSAQTLDALIPKAGTLPLLNDSSVTLSDPSLKIEVFATGLKKPTNMAFLDSGVALVLEKQDGTVRKIENGKLLPDPVLDVNVATYDTRGMLGIAVTKNETAGKQYIFLYYTEAKDGRGDGEDKCLSPSKCIPDYMPNGNKLYRFELSQNGSKLINKKLIFSWPPSNRADHNGGEIVVGPDNNIYVILGQYMKGPAEQVVSKDGTLREIIGDAGILAFNHNGGPINNKGILGDSSPLNRYYAYGIRNSFGLDFDPVTGKLWDTENGPDFGDEINLVEPGFNSGWKVVAGVWKKVGNTTEFIKNVDDLGLNDFNGKGRYSSPELAWNNTIGITALKFFNSDKLGKNYENDIFVGSVKPDGDLYHFELNKKRTGLFLPSPLKDKIVNNYQELDEVIFGKHFGLISDITVGPDGYLYIVSLDRGEIFRIIPA